MGRPFSRVPLCIMVSGIFSSFSLSNTPQTAVIILFCVPHTLMWGSLFMLIYEWASISHHARANVLVQNVFKKHLGIFYCSVGMVAIAVCASFTIFFRYINHPVRIVGPLTLMVVSGVSALCISHYGRNTLKVMRSLVSQTPSNGSAPSRNRLSRTGLQSSKYYVSRKGRSSYKDIRSNSKSIPTLNHYPSPRALTSNSISSQARSQDQRVKTIVTIIGLISICLLIQSFIWVIASTFGFDQVVFLSIMVTFYVCDLLIVMMQLDFMKEMRGMLALRKLGGYLISISRMSKISGHAQGENSNIKPSGIMEIKSERKLHTTHHDCRQFAALSYSQVSSNTSRFGVSGRKRYNTASAVHSEISRPSSPITKPVRLIEVPDMPPLVSPINNVKFGTTHDDSDADEEDQRAFSPQKGIVMAD
mmetsp:Transcript_33981/g.63043  ORF Transcript_33981/g.63043 Transcript_33981/m.63043 type:complete len:418 (-) Transcript_33981:338-1591(-)